MNKIAAQGKRCKAKAKSTGERCQNAAIRGFSVCGVHGAGRPKYSGRVAGRPIKSGRYSHRYQSLISDARAKRVEDALKDPELLSLIPRLAVLDVRFQEVWENLGSKESGEAWKQLRVTWDQADATMKDKALDSAERNRQFTQRWGEMGAIINEGLAEYREWDELRSVTDDIRRLVDTEAKRIKMIEEIVTIQEVRAFIGRVLDVVQKRMTKEGFTAIVYDLEQELVRLESDGR